MAMAENLREKIVETNRDVKWICRTLQKMEERDKEMEGRLRALENWRSEAAGEEKRERQIAAGAGGVVGGIVAVVVKVMGWG
jgi:chromosome segregation ATPase